MTDKDSLPTVDLKVDVTEVTPNKSKLLFSVEEGPDSPSIVGDLKGAYDDLGWLDLLIEAGKRCADYVQPAKSHRADVFYQAVAALPDDAVIVSRKVLDVLQDAAQVQRGGTLYSSDECLGCGAAGDVAPIQHKADCPLLPYLEGGDDS